MVTTKKKTPKLTRAHWN